MPDWKDMSPAQRWATILLPAFLTIMGVGGGFKLGESSEMHRNSAKIEMIIDSVHEIKQDIRIMRIRGQYSEGPLTQSEWEQLNTAIEKSK